MSNRIEKEYREKKSPVRLNKYLSDAGVRSRPEADRLIESGRVTVDGRTAQTGMKVIPGQEVRVGEKDCIQTRQNGSFGSQQTGRNRMYGRKRERNSIVRFLDYPIRITYVGRLDKDSRGLLLMTNNGDIINKMMRAGNRHEKEYKVDGG